IQRSNTALFERSHNIARYFINLVARMMKFKIRNGTSRVAHILAVHAADKTDKRLGVGEGGKDFGSLVRQLRPVHLNKTDVVCTGIDTQLPQPPSIEFLPRRFSIRSIHPFLKSFNRRMFGKVRHMDSFVATPSRRQQSYLFPISLLLLHIQPSRPKKIRPRRFCSWLSASPPPGSG